MKIKIGTIELEISNADNSVFFGEEIDTRRLSITLSDNETNIEDLVYLKQYVSSIILITSEGKEEEFVGYSLENIRKNYGGNNRITIDFVKK